jgi:hypothetical protein
MQSTAQMPANQTPFVPFFSLSDNSADKTSVEDPNNPSEPSLYEALAHATRTQALHDHAIV